MHSDANGSIMKTDHLFVESISKLGLSKAQLEAVVKIHNIAYGNHMLMESSEEKKYELTDETMELEDEKGRAHTLYRIKALKSIDIRPNWPSPRRIEAGKVGGWIESEKNLSQEGNCFVDDDAKVYGNAQVRDDAYVYFNGEVYENAEVYGSADIGDYSKVHGSAKLYDNAYTVGYDFSEEDKGEEPDPHGPDVSGNAEVYEHAELDGKCTVSGNAKIHGDVAVPEEDISGDADIASDEELDEYLKK